jgi:hypothetical protein
MSLFLILGPAVFAGFLLTNPFRPDFKDRSKHFLLGLAASAAAILAYALTRGWFPPLYGNLLGLFSFWFREFFWYGLAGAGIFLLVPSFRRRGSERRPRLLCFLLGAFAPAGLVSFFYLGLPRDIYFVLYLPLLRIAFALLLSYTIDKALSEYGGMLALWIGLAILTGPALSLVPVFHFWSLPLLSLPLLLLALGAAYLSLFSLPRILRRR